MLVHQKTKTFSQKATFQIGLSHGLIENLNGEEVIEMFDEKELQKAIQAEFKIKKRIRKLHIKWEGYDNSFNSKIDKKRYLYIKWFVFYNHIFRVEKKIKFALGLSNHATKSNLKGLIGINT